MRLKTALAGLGASLADDQDAVIGRPDPMNLSTY